jgi:hypothetical protein
MTIFTFGDSHSVHPFDKLAYVNRNTIGAVLAHSIGRDRLARLDLRKFPVEDDDIVIFCFGEIDCRCHIHKYVTEETSYQSIIKKTVDSYFEGLRDIVSHFNKLNVYVYNVIPPIEVDSTVWNNPKYPFLGTNEDRKNYARYFNECISANCQSYGYGFFDIFDKYTDSNGYLIRSESDNFVHIINAHHHNEFMVARGFLQTKPSPPNMKATLGQIHPETLAGRVLMGLVQHDMSINTILDVGCWNGLGTTLCCVLGALSRPEYAPIKILALETNRENLQYAKENWATRPGREMVDFVNGRIATSLMSDEEIHAHPTFLKNKPHYDLWYESDKRAFMEVPLVEVRQAMDVVILDGGEYCGFSDYQEACKLNPKYIFLDDTDTMKTDKVLEHAQKNGFNLVFQSAERNGVALLKRNA